MAMSDVLSNIVDMQYKAALIRKAKQEMAEKAPMSQKIRGVTEPEFREDFNVPFGPMTRPQSTALNLVSAESSGIPKWAMGFNPSEYKDITQGKENMRPKVEERQLFFNPTTKLTSDIEKPGFYKLKESTIAQIMSRPGTEFSNAGNLRKELLDRPEVKDFLTINTQVKSMDALLKGALSGNIKNQLALDQGLITMFNKLTDPNSVVRESEYARTPENLPFVNRIAGAIEKLQQGGAGITNEDRQALVLGAKIIGNERGKAYQATVGNYANLSNQFNVNPSLITTALPDYAPYDMGGQQQTQGQVVKVGSLEEANRLPPGTRFEFNGRTGTVK